MYNHIIFKYMKQYLTPERYSILKIGQFDPFDPLCTVIQVDNDQKVDISCDLYGLNAYDIGLISKTK